MRAADADELSAWPHGFVDGARGALALLADRLDVTSLRRRFAVVEEWSSYGEGYFPWAWPLACDAALATFAARAALVGHPAFELAYALVCETEGAEPVRAAAEALLARLDANAESWEDWYTYAFLRAHHTARGGAAAYTITRGHATPSAGWAAQLMRWAMERDCLKASEIVALVESWAPAAEHVARVRTPGLAALRTGEAAPEVVAASWPGFAVVVDGTTDRTIPDTLAASFATTKLERAIREARVFAEGVRGFGLVALGSEGRGLVIRRGTVGAWVADESGFDATVEGEHTCEGGTWALHVGAMTPRRPKRNEASLAAWAKGDTVDAFAALREPPSPSPRVPRFVEAHDRARVLVDLAVPLLVDAYGLDLRVRFVEDPSFPTDGAHAQDVVVALTVVRDDVEGAADESAVADAVARALRERPELEPFRVDATYVK